MSSALLLLSSCGSELPEPVPGDASLEETVEVNEDSGIRGKGHELVVAKSERRRLAGWPDDESRLRLQTNEPGVLIFGTGGAFFGEQPEELDLCKVGTDRLVVRVGPVGEWHANDTLYILIDAGTHKILAAGVYIHSDVAGMGGWGTIHGRIWFDSIYADPGSGKLRCGYELFAEGEPDEVWFEGHFELDASSDSASLRKDLESFGVNFPE